MQPSFPLWLTVVLTASCIGIPVLAWLVFQRFARLTARSLVLPSAAFVAAWLVLAFTLSARGFFSSATATGVPPIAYALVPLAIGYIAYLSSRSVRAVIREIPLHWMIGFQLYRALGFVFLIEWSMGALPAVFALPAGIGDMAIGITAPFVAVLVARATPNARRVALLWNVLGIVDLVVAVTTGVLSSPGALHLLALDAPNRAVAMFPLVLVPTIAVPLSILLHLISLHRLSEGVRPAVAATGERLSEPHSAY